MKPSENELERKRAELKRLCLPEFRGKARNKGTEKGPKRAGKSLKPSYPRIKGRKHLMISCITG